MRLHIQARIKNRYLSFTTFIALCARLFCGITKKKKKQILQHWVTHIYSPFNATIRETATSRNERCQSKSKYKAAQQDLSTILCIHICSLCFFVSFCSCVATSAICARPVILSEKKCVRAFRKDAFRNKKTWKTKTTAGKQNESGRGKAAGNKERNGRGGKKVTRIGANSGFHAATSTHRSSPTLSFDSRSSYFVIIARV